MNKTIRIRAFFGIFGHFRSQIGILLAKIGTMPRCYCLLDSLNSLLVLYKIFEKAKQLSKVSHVVTHDEQLHVGCGCEQTHLFRGPPIFCIM